ncbi:translation initiation factor IF-2, mitochondrial-like [Amphiura filiformis]|uniref:translation initiation factor IF-2, mitochondrial-like n=1 Tax=Amphiura filiformis TaxID=82378 RepID=UPI003B21312A
MFPNTRCVLLRYSLSEVFRHLWMPKSVSRCYWTKGTRKAPVAITTVNINSVCRYHTKNCVINRTRTRSQTCQWKSCSSAIIQLEPCTVVWDCHSRTYSVKSNFHKDHGKKSTQHKRIPRKKEKKTDAKKKVVEILPLMTVKQLAEAMDGNKDDFVDFLHRNRFIKAKFYNHVLSADEIKSILQVMGMSYHITHTPKENKVKEVVNLDAVRRPPPDPTVLTTRPPVVTIMGHVDHGKTTLLDTLRKTSVAAGEAGGITQHIGAFLVELESQHQITFLDTPGHAAFSTMRERGANVTDIVVLVVAADDSVMEQTRESIRFAQNAKVPIIVAINKCDRPNADPELTKMDLLSHGIQLESSGGDVQAVEISALKGTNVDALMEAIITLAEVQEIRGDSTGAAEAVVIESKVDKGKGAIATLVVQRGTLKKGAILVAGKCLCKVRAMFNENDRPIKEVPPGTPVEVSGWRDVPSAGDVVLQVETDSRAREVIRWRQDQENQIREEEIAIKLAEEEATKERKHYSSYEERREHMRQMRRIRIAQGINKEKEIVPNEDPELNIVIKGDVDGSVEAILDALASYDAHDQCKLNIIHYGVGGISAKDVEVAQTFSGAVVGFNVTASLDALKLAQDSSVPLMMHNIIYRLMDEIRENCSSRLPPIKEQVIVGEASILMSFEITVGSRKLMVAGCKVTKGELSLSGMYRLIRNKETLFEGSLASLKHKKDDVRSVKKDMECGVRFKKVLEYQIGDVIECYREQTVPQKLEWNLGF